MDIASTLRSLHWRRGLRAGFAVATAMIVCRLLGRPMGWAALGGFEAVLVDNGGPYRSRLNTIVTVLAGGALAGILGTLVPTPLAIAALVTAAVCFAVTFARVVAQPIASTSVILLVLYFAGFGSSDRTLHAALANVLSYILGGAWAATLSLFLWPVDPFRPARIEVAACYDLLAAFTSGIHVESASASEAAPHAVDLRRTLRATMESTRAALAATPARAPSRTIRARNLSVLLETADMLFAATVRMAELAELMPDAPHPQSESALADIALWLSAAEHDIAAGLRTHPADEAASYGPQGSHRIQHVDRRAALLAAHTHTAAAPSAPDAFLRPLVDDERDALQNIEIAFDALHAVWTGREDALHIRLSTPSQPTVSEPGIFANGLAAIRENWTLDSVMLRHALRMAVVGAADVVIMRAIHVSHGFWLAMTSIIVLQPYGSGTLRRGVQRVGGTVAGGLLAALLAAAIHTESGIIVAITAGSVLTLATYAIDYAWYSFFLTPTFVLMSLPYLRDWRYSGVRILTTMLGAAVSVVAMRVLWPQSLTLELGEVLSRSAAASAAYLRATLAFWQAPRTARAAADRQVLAPARRACGLTSQDAEEALDRILLEPGAGSFSLATRAAPEKESALTFTTYIRRFTQCLTTLASVGAATPTTTARVETLIARLDVLAASLAANLASNPHSSSAPMPAEPWAQNSEPSPSGLADQMLQRMERQAGVLERAAGSILSTPAVSTAARVLNA